MSDFDRNYAAARPGVGLDRAAIDAGLRAHMIRVYNYMAMGVALTGVVAWIAFQMAGGDAIAVSPRGISGLTPFGQLIFSMPGQIVLFLGTLGMVGVMLSSIFLVYTGVSITRVFFISAASFGALSLWGYTTQRDLSGMGSFLMMGVIGIMLAMLVNIFLKSTQLDFIISCIGVLCFAGLTAYDTQKIKEMYEVNDDGTVSGRKAVMGALSLYLDFINLFQFLLRLVGDRR